MPFHYYYIVLLLLWGWLAMTHPGRASQRASVEGVVRTFPSCFLLFFSSCFPPVQLCVWHSHLWRWPLFLHSSLHFLFQSSTVLFEKKFLITYNLAAWGLKLSGSAALLVSRSAPSTFWNQTSLFTMSLPVMILYTCAISVWWRHSSRVVSPSSRSFSS